MTSKFTASLAASIALLSGCDGDFSLPRARPLAPLSGSVLSTRNVAVSWTRADPGDAPLCLDVCAARACDRPRTATLPLDVTEYVIPDAMLPEGRAVFWRVRDCGARDEALHARVPVWQFSVPRSASSARASVEAMTTDLDGDALPDLVYQRAGATPRGRVLRERPVTGWAGSVLSIAPPADARDATLRFAVAGDLDGNGFADMLVLGRTVEVILGGMSAELDDVLPTRFALPRGADAAGGRDLDDDGRGDVVIASPGALRVCHLDAGLGDLDCATSSAPGADARSVQVRTLADLDGDASPELSLAVVGGVEAGSIWTRWSATSQWRRAAAGYDGRTFVSLGDLDGDGRGELGWTRGPTSLVVASWRDGAVVSRVLEVPCGATAVLAEVVSADLDGDGLRDLAARCADASGTQRLFVFAGASSSAREVSLADGDLDARSGGLLAADDDGDGVSDLFVRTAAGSLARLALPRETPRETPEATPAARRAPLQPTRTEIAVEIAEGTSAEGGASWTLGHLDDE